MPVYAARFFFLPIIPIWYTRTGGVGRIGVDIYKLEHRLGMALAALLCGSGLVQLVQPGLMLRQMGASPDALASQLAATAGLFMAIIGGLLLQALWTRQGLRLILPWVVLEKAGYVVLLLWGLHQGVLQESVLPVAVLDSCAALLFLDLWRRGSGTSS